MKRLLKAVVLTALGSLSAQAADVGQSLAPLQLQDQFGNALAVTANTRRVYFTHDMAGGKLLKGALGDQGQAVLDAQQAVAVTDVSGMPSMVRNMMALPAMKKRSYKIGVDASGAASAALPRQPDQVTVIDLEQLVIRAVRFAADEKSLQAMVRQ